MKIKLIILFCLFGFIKLYSQTYQRDGKGIKFIQLEGCVRTDNGNTCDSCFVITNGVNGKLNRCLHISQLRSLLLGGEGSADSTYLVDNADGSYSLFNENGMEYQFGYQLDVSTGGDTLFLKDWDGHISNYILAQDFDNQTLSWNPATKELGIANGNTVVLTGLGVDSIKLSLSGNQMEMKVNTLTDTSLVIGQNQIQLSGDVLTSIVNGVVDTAELNSLTDGNGIYGGSGVVPDSTYARVGQDTTFAIGAFPSFPSTNNSDRGIILGGSYVGLQGNHFFGGQKITGQYSYGRVTCDDVTWRVQNPFSLPAVDVRIVAEENKIDLYNGSFGRILMDADSLQTTYGYISNLSSFLSFDINGSRGTDGQVLTSQGGYTVWADPCCDTMEAGGGVDSISLGISGNVMTMGVNALTDTSLIIGELNTNLSGNIITTEVNNVTDTTLAVGNVTSSLSGTILTTSVNGVSDTAQLSGILSSTTNVLSYANPILTSTVNGVTDTALVSISGVADVDLDLAGNVMTSTVDGVSDTSLVIGELNTNLSGNTLTTEINNVTDTSLVIGSNVLSWNATDKILTSSVNGVSDTSFVTGLNGIYSGSGNVPNDTYAELLTSEEFAIGYFTDFGGSIFPVIDRGMYLKTNGTYIVGGDSTNTVRNAAEFLKDGTQIWSDSVSMESRIIVNKDSLVGRVMYVANNEGSRIAMWADSMKLQQDYNNLIIQGSSITLNDHAGTGRGTSGQVWHSNGTSGYWDNVSAGASSNTLSLSGNTMTSNVDGVIDTSLVIGELSLNHQTSSNIMALEINNETDTALIIHNFSFGVVGNTLTGYINSVPASTTVILKDSLELSGNTMQLMVNGVYDTCVVIGELNTNLSGNTLTTEVNNVTDTSLVIGSHVISWDSTNKILTSSVNGISDTTKITVASGNVSTNTLTWDGANTLTSNVEGISDTSFIYNIDSIKIGKVLSLGSGTTQIRDINGSYGNADDILLNAGSGEAYWIDKDYKSIQNQSTITSDQDDYTSAYDIQTISGDNGIRAITSISSTNIVPGQIITYVNSGSYPIYFPSNHPDAGAANEIEYKEDIILLPKASIQFMWLDNSADDYWIPLSIPNVNGYKVYEFSGNAGSTTAGDHAYFAFAASGSTGTQGPTATIPLAAFTSNTGAGATNAAAVEVTKTIEEFCYLGESHIMGEWLISIPNLSDATDSFEIICQFLQNPAIATKSPNNSWGFRYSHGANGGEWYGYSQDNGGTVATIDLNTVVTANAIYNLRLEADKSRTELRFYINGEYKGRITSNLANASLYSMRNGIWKGVGTTSRSLYTHRVSYRIVTP